MSKKQTRDKVFRYLGGYGPEIKTKFCNICGKTGQYNVPSELFQKRTSRRNRALISWKTVEKNKLTIKDLESFSGGVVVEFINNDYFDIPDNNPTYNELRKRLGSDKIVSSIISIRTEDGSSSSSIPRQSLELLKSEYPDFSNNIIRRKEGVEYSGVGNDKWEGSVYVSIKGGQQDTIATHGRDVRYQLFNPACEFANENTCVDIDLVMSYFALHSIDVSSLNEEQKSDHRNILEEVAKCLKECNYNNSTYVGNLLDFCNEHPCLVMKKNNLFDPIQVTEIFINDFSITDKNDNRNLDFTHDEAVNKDKYYWDQEQGCILSAARPTNIFWSKHLSNMMQQNFSLNEYFEHEENIVERRKELLRNS